MRATRGIKHGMLISPKNNRHIRPALDFAVKSPVGQLDVTFSNLPFLEVTGGDHESRLYLTYSRDRPHPHRHWVLWNRRLLESQNAQLLWDG